MTHSETDAAISSTNQPKIIQCTSFGQFGNALFQYCFARAFAEQHVAALETTYWVGQRLFLNIDEPPPSCKLPKTMMDQIPTAAGVDLHGYFQNEESLSFYSVKQAKEWLRFQETWTKEFPKIKEKYIAIHVRHGDYVSRYLHQFCVPRLECTIEFARKLQKEVGDLPIIMVSEETSLGSDDPELSFLPDFFTLMQADYLIRANSSFSWWAGTLGNGKVYCPVVGDLVGWHDVQYVEGNSETLLKFPNHGRLYLRPV